jgi:N-acetylmuramoyl-L-alanine amidase
MTQWLSNVTKLPVTYNKPQMAMSSPILGAVLHTTNHTGGAETLERFQTDWQAAQAQSAHFMIDRAGRIGQFRALTEVAWHITMPSIRYIGIEHMAHPGEQLTDPQANASSALLSALRNELGISLQALPAAEKTGIGIHRQFAPTGCGLGVFTNGGGFSDTFLRILQNAVIAGQWEVKVGDWTWIYRFNAGGSAEWRAFVVSGLSRDPGTGTWVLTDKFRITWNTGSVEEWDTPLRDANQSGRLTRQGFNNAALNERERKIVARRTG